jgi:aminoglycoside phosphotransferase (APT) family kinase protein
MTEPEASPTQRILARTDVERLVHASFGPECSVRDCGPLGGGGFAAVWWVRLDDGRTVVLKTSPPAGVPLLTYERGLLDAEVHYYRLVAARTPEVPMPRVLHHGTDPRALDGEWMFMTMVPGRPLTDLAAEEPPPDVAPVRRDLGAAYAQLHAVTGERFGYDGDRISGSSWRGVFTAMVEELLADGAAWGVHLTVAPSRIRAVLDRHGDLLDSVRRPALVHFDGWDGNVLAAPGPDGVLALSGLVDGERWLFADPLMDFVSPVLYRRVEDEPEHPFRVGYGPLSMDLSARRRIALYRLHLVVLMTVEMPSRAMSLDSHAQRHERLATALDELVRELEEGHGR